MKSIRSKLLIYILIFAFVFIAVTIASQSSFLFRLNDWYDANCYFSVGKKVLSGGVIYRDIYEQKGPYIYFVHALALLISNTNYYGIYIIELICGFFVGVGIYKIMNLFFENKKKSILLTLLAITAYYVAPAFAQGDSVEELLMPFFMFSLYFSIKSLKLKKSYNFFEALFLGLTLGFALFTKFTLIVIPGIFLFLVFIFDMKDKRISHGLLNLFIEVLGLGIAMAPVMLYFGLNHATHDLYQAYFYNNIFVYSSAGDGTGLSLLQKIGNFFLGLGISVGANYPVYLFLIISLIFAIRHKLMKNRIVIFTLLSFLTVLVLTYIGGRLYVYYAMALSVFGAMGVVGFGMQYEYWVKLPNFVKKLGAKFVLVFIPFLLLWQLVLNEDVWCMFRKSDSYPQYQMSEYIKEYKKANPNEEVTLLNYGFLDCGLYLMTDTTPTCKYFVGLNINLKELQDTQDEFVKEGKVTFVVSSDLTPKDVDLKYTLVMELDGYREWAMHKFYLYELK